MLWLDRRLHFERVEAPRGRLAHGFAERLSEQPQSTELAAPTNREKKGRGFETSIREMDTYTDIATTSIRVAVKLIGDIVTQQRSPELELTSVLASTTYFARSFTMLEHLLFA
jgi:hypothetical protein